MVWLGPPPCGPAAPTLAISCKLQMALQNCHSSERASCMASPPAAAAAGVPAAGCASACCAAFSAAAWAFFSAAASAAATAACSCSSVSLQRPAVLTHRKSEALSEDTSPLRSAWDSSSSCLRGGEEAGGSLLVDLNSRLANLRCNGTLRGRQHCGRLTQRVPRTRRPAAACYAWHAPSGCNHNHKRSSHFSITSWQKLDSSRRCSLRCLMFSLRSRSSASESAPREWQIRWN